MLEKKAKEIEQFWERLAPNLIKEQNKLNAERIADNFERIRNAFDKCRRTIKLYTGHEIPTPRSKVFS